MTRRWGAIWAPR